MNLCISKRKIAFFLKIEHTNKTLDEYSFLTSPED